jgi:Transglutaminase-like superfamily
MSAILQRIRARSPIFPEVPLILKSGVILMPVEDGSARLLDLGGRFYAVSAIAAEMIGTAVRHGPRAAAAMVAARYGVGMDRTRQDMMSLVGFLQQQRLLKCKEPGRTGSLLTSMLLAPMLFLVLRSPIALEPKAWLLLGLAKLSFRLFGWTRTVATWRRHSRPVGGLVRDTAEPDTIMAVDRAVRAAASRQLLTVECKERALCCWALLQASGISASLVVGINLFPLEGHCWCEAIHQLLSDYPDRCATFSPVVRYQ